MIELKPVESEDLETIYGFICELEEVSFDLDIFKEIFLKNIDNQNIIYLKAIFQSQISGFISCHLQYLLHHCALIGEIQEMYVSPAFRSQGVGKKLLDETIEICKKRGVSQLEVTSNKKREAAHQFYLSNSFKHTSLKFVRYF